MGGGAASSEKRMWWAARPVRDVYRTDLVGHGHVLALCLALVVWSWGSWGNSRLRLFSLSAVAANCLGWAVQIRRDRIARRLAAAVGGFRTASRVRTVLHYDPGLDPLEVALFHAACEQEVEALSRRSEPGSGRGDSSRSGFGSTSSGPATR